MRGLIVTASLFALVVPLSAQAMTVDEFLAKAKALKAKGMMAMFSSDLKEVKAELQSATAAWNADEKARKAAGKPPLSCEPPGAKMTQDEFMAGLEALPPAQRARSFREGYAQVAIRRYPCR